MTSSPWAQPAANEVFCWTLRFALRIELYADHFVSGGHATVPGTVKGYEQASTIFRRKHVAVIEDQPQGSGVRLHLDFGSNSF